MNNSRNGMRRLALAGFLACATLATAAPRAAHAGPQLGINLDWNYDWAPQQMFIDTVKAARGWGVANLNGDSQADGCPRDANGWPTNDTMIAAITEPGNAADWVNGGAYSIQFTGQATITDFANPSATVTNQVYNSGTNTTTATLNEPAGVQFVWPQFTATKRTSGSATNTGLTNLIIARPGYTVAQSQSQIFTTDVINKVKAFTCFRTMNAVEMNTCDMPPSWFGQAQPGGITYPTQTDWVNRRPVTYPLQNGTENMLPSGSNDVRFNGVSWEYMVALANQCNTDIWINIPVPATDNYITKLAQLLLYGSDGTNPYTSTQGSPVWAPLHSGAHVYVELGNEIWNGAFPQGSYLAAMGSALGVGDQYAETGNRTAQISNLFSAVWGSGAINNSIRVVLPGQHTNAGVVDKEATYLQAHYGNVHNFVYGFCTAPYVFGSGSTTSAIETSLINGSNGDVASRESDWAEANKYSVVSLAYEGGPDLSQDGGAGQAALNAASLDSGMQGVIVNDLLNNWFNLTYQGVQGGPFMFYEVSSNWTQNGGSVSGDWGLSQTPHSSDMSQPKWLGVLQVLGALAPPTNLTATPASGQASLSWTGVSGATTYNVYRGTTAGGENGTAIATGITTTNYTNTGLSNGSTYYFTVAAVSSAGTSGYSNEASAALLAPAAPTGLSVTPGNGQMALAWTASNGAVSYNVYRGTTAGGENSTAIATGISTINYTDTTTANGTTYYYKVAAVNVFGTSGNSNEASGVSNAPSAPSNLTATSGNTQIILGWSAATGATSYSVYRGTSAGGESGTAIATGIATTSYTDSGLTNGTTYYYTVKAVNTIGTSGASNEASAIPAIPTGIMLASEPFAEATGALNGASGGSGWASAWLEQSGLNTVPGYNVANTSQPVYTGLSTSGNYGVGGLSYQSVGRAFDVTPGGNFGANGYLTGSLIGASGKTLWFSALMRKDSSNTNPIQLQLVNNNTSGGQWVLGTALDMGGYFTSGNSFWSMDVNGTVYPSTVPITVGSTALLVMSVTFGATTTVSLYVNPTSLGGGAPSPTLTQTTTANLGFNSMVYMGGYAAGDSSIDEARIGTTYAVVTPTSGGSAPSAPTGLTATSGNTQVALVWNSSTGATSYSVYRGTTAGGESGTAIVTGVSTTTYTNTGLTNGTTYYYTVKAVNSVGTSGASNEASATPSAPSPPPAPTGLTATPGNAQVALAWNASSGATAYNVLRSTVNGSGYAAVVSQAGLTYTNTGLTNGTTYYFVVTATNANGTSGNSNQASATPSAPTPPPAPTGLTATAGNTQVALAWNASTGATTYNVLRSTVNGSGYAAVVSQAGLTYTNTGLTNGTTYYFVVTATNANGTSGNSNQASATPQPGAPSAPTGLSATSGNAQVSLTWNSSTGATSYSVYRGTTSGGESGTAIATGVATTSYTDTGLTNGTTYYYTVKAVNAGGTSGASNEASATPSAGGGGTMLGTEPFAEATGAMHNANGGTGWNGAWNEQSGSTAVPGYDIINTTPLTYTGIPTSGNYGVGGLSYQSVGRWFDVTTGGNYGSNGYVTSSLIGTSGKTIWFSALIRKDTSTEDANNIELLNNSSNWAIGNTLDVGYFGSGSDSGGNRYWSLELNGTVYRTSAQITIGSTALIVMSVTFGATNTVNVYVNPTSLGGSAPSPTLTETTGSSLAFNSLVYYGGITTGESSIDEIRLGTTYAVVTP